jgi:hypothetical protein
VSSRGLGRVVVGYRANDRRRLQLLDTYGITSVPIRKCMAGCGYDVYFYSGGVDAVRERDAEVVCDECRQRYYPEIMAEI